MSFFEKHKNFKCDKCGKGIDVIRDTYYRLFYHDFQNYHSDEKTFCSLKCLKEQFKGVRTKPKKKTAKKKTTQKKTKSKTKKKTTKKNGKTRKKKAK